MKKLLLSLIACTIFAMANAATITLINSSSNNKFSLTTNITGVEKGASQLQYSGLDGTTALYGPLLKNKSAESGSYSSEVIIVPNHAGSYTVTVSANVDGNLISSNSVTISVSDAQYRQLQSQVHQIESQAVQTIKAEAPLIKQEVQQQQQFVDQLSNAINGQ